MLYISGLLIINPIFRKYGQKTRCKSLLAFDNNNNLTFCLVHGKMFGEFAERADMKGFVEFGDFSADRTFAILAKGFGELAEGSGQPEGGFIDYDRPLLFGELAQTRGATFFQRKEAFEKKSVARQPGAYKGRDKSRRTGETLDIDSRFATCTGKHESRVADSGGAGIGNQCYVLSRLNLLDDSGDGGMLIIAVMTSEGGMNIVMTEKHAARARVFGKDQISLLEHAQGAERDVLEVPDRRGNDIKFSSHQPNDFNTISIKAATSGSSGSNPA